MLSEVKYFLKPSGYSDIFIPLAQHQMLEQVVPLMVPVMALFLFPLSHFAAMWGDVGWWLVGSCCVGTGVIHEGTIATPLKLSTQQVVSFFKSFQ